MTLTHSTAVRNGVADLVVDDIDGGTGAGAFLLLTAADAVVAELPFSDPAFAAASGGAAAANAITSDTNAAGGEVAKFAWVDGDDTVIVEGTVTGTGGGGDIEMTSTTVAATETVSCSSATYTAMN
jgi:hypothetical protein